MKRICTRTGAVALVMALAVSTASHADEESDAKVLVTKVVSAIPKNSFTAKLTLSSSDFAPRELQMSRKYIEGAHGSYLEVTSPDELEGIRFLFLEHTDKPDEQYIKVKASRNPVRVQEGVRTQPFLGSAFYVSDLVLPEVDNYTYKYLGKDVVGGRSVNLVEMTPKDPDKEVYAKTVLALDPKDLACDILFVGMPCQAFSVAGQHQPFEDEDRSDTYWALLAIFRNADAKVIVVECARKFLSRDGGDDATKVRRELAKAGSNALSVEFACTL